MLQVEYVPINDIKPYKGNAKTHPQEQIEQIKKSILEFGFNDPIATWQGQVVEGHGRLEAAKQLGHEKVPVIRLDELTDEQRRAYGLVHNQLTMNTPFDLESLKIELDSIGDIDLTDMGFDLTLHDDYTEQTIVNGGEINTEDYSDDKFSCTCPQCGFKFNPKG
jgi:ParB-like chromosome segregation protein Spo0J